MRYKVVARSLTFKRDLRNKESLAGELVAFSNSKGGTMLVGVADDGAVTDLSGEDVAALINFCRIRPREEIGLPSIWKPRMFRLGIIL